MSSSAHKRDREWYPREFTSRFIMKNFIKLPEASNNCAIETLFMVGELFKAAGQYFSQLGDAAVELQLVLDQNAAQNSAQYKIKKDGSYISQGTSQLPSISGSTAPAHSYQPTTSLDGGLSDVKNVSTAPAEGTKE